MSLWHCHDRLSGERFEVHGSDEETVGEAVRAYIADGLDSDSGTVGYDVEATAVDGSTYCFDGTLAG